ncbi:hypothetical protein BAY1663_02316 [Pseudomonas sp. BAY1663]|uniref:hypothetical protein n=1 Tax=Pseudomonas sp. BAY1663 TaxID=1439940 RepID=UPI00042DECC6|nr:hypothetical protein [Pseudomonas sp. BAY1663]EXF45237.1 hypothetical protein BAY1663_02316 [Pseudomonas sp. BAY1663]
MTELIPHNDIVEDLEKLKRIDVRIVYRVRELINQLRADPDLLDDLLRDGYGGSPARPAKGAIFNIRAWGAAQSQCLNLWRIRDFSLSRKGLEYRIVYAVFPKTDQIFVLGIVERDFDYELSHPVSQRIVAAYRAIEEDIW